MKFSPDILTFDDGSPVSTPSDWKKRREEILRLFSGNMFGFVPAAPEKVTGRTDKKTSTASGHAWTETVSLSFDTPSGEFSFPFHFTYPKSGGPFPVFVFINFRPEIYDQYCPLEEIIDNGFAVASVWYSDISSDNGDFSDGLAAHFPRSTPVSPGKISLWAYACSRIADYILTREETDPGKLAVIGHSRLGKTALWCSANDERFRFAISNCSGCCGAAYEKKKHGNAETYNKIWKVFPYWFCEKFESVALGTDPVQIDQHMLIALSAPGYVCVGSAALDEWADPFSEQMSCIGASPAWKVNGLKGFKGPKKPASAGDHFSDGEIHYHLTDGEHYLGRENWNRYMQFIKSK